MKDPRYARAVDALLDRASARHGGARTAEIAHITLRPRSLVGLVPALKGLGRTFPLPASVEIDPHRLRTVFNDFPTPGRRGFYDAGRVWVEGETPREGHRRTFRGVRKWRRWDPLDALYFFGYALAYYHALPALLREAEVLGLGPTRRSGATQALTVRFPETLHTHCREQTFYFDESGLIVRHDYFAEVIGAWTRAAHTWRDFIEIEGIPIATRRLVFARLGRLELPLVALDAVFETPLVIFR